MDKEMKKAIDVASDRAAQDAVEAIKPYFDKKVNEVRQHFDVTKEEIISEIKALGEVLSHRGYDRFDLSPLGRGETEK